jgi:hypothetical protein
MIKFIEEIFNYVSIILGVKKIKAMCDSCNKCEYNNINNWTSYNLPVKLSAYQKIYKFNHKMMNPQFCPVCIKNEKLILKLQKLNYVKDTNCTSIENFINFNKIYSYIIFIKNHKNYTPSNVFNSTNYIIKLFNNNIDNADIKLLIDMDYITEE